MVEKPQGEEVGFCTLIVEIKMPRHGGWPNLDGTQVTLRQGGKTLDIRQTDAFGKAIFRRVPINELPEISVEITPAAYRAPLSA